MLQMSTISLLMIESLWYIINTCGIVVSESTSFIYS